MQQKLEMHSVGANSLARASHSLGLPPALRNTDVSLGEIGAKIWKHRVAGFFVAALIFLAVVVYTFTKRPVYESVAQIRVDSSQQGSL